MFNKEDLHMESYPPRGNGQYAGTVTGVKITHIPTGTISIVTMCRSQHKNKEIALEMLLAGLTHKYAEI